jgi:hypothetical protein
VNFIQNQLTPDVEWSAGLSYWQRMPRLAALGATADDFAPRRLPGLVGFSFANVKLAYGAGRWTLDFDEQGARLHLVLSALRPGPTATSWTIGPVTAPGTPHYLSTFAWSVLAGTSTATGTLDEGNLHVAIDGWRASLDHTFGKFEQSLMQHWDWAAGQSASGGWLVDGFETGPGVSWTTAHDARWSGVLVRATPGGTTFCRAHVTRGRWTHFYDGIKSYIYPRSLVASCGGTSVSIASGVVLGGGYGGTVESSAVGTSGAFGVWLDRTWIP